MRTVHNASGGQLIAIDGKTFKSSYHRNARLSTIHMVNAFACENGVVLGQQETDCKSNEITAIPVLLNQLEITSCLVAGCMSD